MITSFLTLKGETRPRPDPAIPNQKKSRAKQKSMESGAGRGRRRRSGNGTPTLSVGVEWTLRRDGILFADVAEFVFLADIAIFILKKSSRKG